MIIGVTGATGFMGRHLVERLNQEGHTTRALMRDPEKETDAKEKVKGDLETAEGLEEFLTGVDVVVNLVGRFPPPFKDQLIGNAGNLENLCQAAVKSGTKKIVHISAAAVEQLDTTYSLSKKMAEEVADFYHKNFGLSFVILRPPNVYGPGSDHGVVYNFIKSAKETGGVNIHGDGTQKRDFLFVGDLVDAIVKSINHETAWDIFNVTTSDPKDLNELVSTLSKVMGKDIKANYQGEAQDAKVVSADNSKAMKELGWEPQTSLEEGLAKTL